VSDERLHEEPYEPPQIAERVDIALPLIGGTSGLCAAFTTN
jgi:hypothetical protein